MHELSSVILEASYSSFPTKSLNTNFKTNLDGLATSCRKHSKYDQVPDLSEKAYLTQKSQVPELNETYLVEDMRQLNNDDCHLRIVSNMMEDEIHVDSMSSGEYESICKVLFDAMEEQSEVCGRAKRAISGLSHSNQLRLDRSDREPGTPLPATDSDRQSQKLGLGNLSLNSPNIVAGDTFQDFYCCSKCIPMDVSSILSILTDIFALCGT